MQGQKLRDMKSAGKPEYGQPLTAKYWYFTHVVYVNSRFAWHNIAKPLMRCVRQYNKNRTVNVTDLESSLVTNFRPLGQPQKRPDNRSSNGGIAVRAADGRLTSRSSGATDEECLRYTIYILYDMDSIQSRVRLYVRQPNQRGADPVVQYSHKSCSNISQPCQFCSLQVHESCLTERYRNSRSFSRPCNTPVLCRHVRM